jgi:hypothetical protein
MADGKNTRASNDGSRPPRGALIVIAVGLLATLAAAALANENLAGEAAYLEWVQTKEVPDSRPAEVPGGGGEMQLGEAGLRATGVNVSGYLLFRSAATLTIDAGAPVGSARVLCSMRAPGGTEVAQTPGSRASYPRSSFELIEQPVPESVAAEFSSHGSGLAEVEIEDLPDVFTTEKGIKVEWPTYNIGIERWRWFLPPGPPPATLKLPFTTIWKATKVPAVEISCTLTTSAGAATVSTGAKMSKLPEPIDEG